MFRSRLVSEFGLTIVTYSEPFSAEDLVDQAKTLPRPNDTPGGHKCLLADFRGVDVNGISGAASRRYALARNARIYPQHGEPVAILVSREEDFGIFRMHNQWVEALGLRSENDAFVTLDGRLALKWLAEKTSQPELEHLTLPENSNLRDQAR